jgi:membrane protease YdiL (CAAX protease family)
VKSTRRPTRTDGRTTPLAFLATFGAAFSALELLSSSPPTPVRALAALGVSGGFVAAYELTHETRRQELVARLGLGTPSIRALGAALAAGAAVVTTFVGGAALSGVHLELRSNWPAVLGGALVFHGLAEELIWRGFVFGHLRRGRDRKTAIRRSIPLIALTHVPIIISNGPLVGTLAVATAAITCLPLSYLYERGRRTIWPAAILHGLIGTWQLAERTYPVRYQMVILLATIVAPLSVYAFGDRFFGTSAQHSHTDLEPAMNAMS